MASKLKHKRKICTRLFLPTYRPCPDDFVTSRFGSFPTPPRPKTDNKFSSFQRQLNLYGFRKVVKGRESGCYMHPSFLRDNPEKLTEVRFANATLRMHGLLFPSLLSTSRGCGHGGCFGSGLCGFVLMWPLGAGSIVGACIRSRCYTGKRLRVKYDGAVHRLQNNLTSEMMVG